MSETFINDEDIATYSTVISKHPLFYNFSVNDLSELIRECTIHTYRTKETIVIEGDLIDAVYFILNGQCEVKKRIDSNQSKEFIDQPIATLSEWETIGLSSIGLYSQTEYRTATVIALSDVKVLRIGSNLFYRILKNHYQEDDDRSKQLDILIRMYFIKSVAPFVSIPIQSIKHIAEHIEEISYLSGTTVFDQGDQGDACYIIMTGKVEISLRLDNGNSKILAELENNAIFGETALLMDLPRNATARVLKPTTLLKINKPLFNEITQQHTDTTKALMQLQLKRCRPVKVDNVDIYQQKSADGADITILRNNTLGKYVQLSEQGLFLWNLLDGESSINDIVIHFFLQFHVFDVESIAAQIVYLHETGFVKLNIGEKYITNDTKIPRLIRMISKIQKIMEFRIAFGNSDEWVSNAFNQIGWIFYTRTAIILCMFTIILGGVSFVIHFEQTIQLLSSNSNKWGLFYLQAFLVALSIPLHELAHAFTTKYYGRKVHCFGIGWLWIGPIAFCDTSDMWLSPKKQRIMVDLAGIYLNMILAGLAGLCVYFTMPTYPNLTIILELFALSSYMFVIANLDTTFEFDGYYALMDILDKPNLRMSSIKWGIDTISCYDKTNKLIFINSIVESIKKNRNEALYWSCTILSIFMIHIITPYIVLNYLLAGLFGIRSPVLTIVFTLIAVILSSFSIYKEILLRVRKLT